MAPALPSVDDAGSLHVSRRVTIPADEIAIRVTTSGGPGGQHANRSLTKVVVTWHPHDSHVLSPSDLNRLVTRLGPVVRSSASRFRSQAQNRHAALEQLAQRIADALVPETPRRATKPTAASKRRRVDSKKARSRLKENRRRPSDD